ncbi:lycopene cyclase domain-containing protein [Tessaracoccus sp. SD287]|uniref:lycopene cyclase domain-containing protein n=1 Tax=Tessaracoccus sp. SD287 TaxID=2782008 RepID=UPI001A973758|nr:lycopene cyclase domain-containing protein [Tessaracoccus sp. SD287]MBO1030512.1 lycopene cyclase domain-containing protein [Tessaracoccus sp. SD287]
MDQWQYLILMAGCLLITLPLEFVLGARVYRSPRRLLLSMLPMVVVFSAWDVVGILRKHWWYEPRFMSGLHIGPLPLEELVFFLVIPICGLLSYEAVGRVFALVRGRGRWGFRWREGLVRVEDAAPSAASQAGVQHG